MNLQLVYPRAIIGLGLPVYLTWKYVLRGQETKKKKVFNGESRNPDLGVIFYPTTTTVESR